MNVMIDADPIVLLYFLQTILAVAASLGVVVVITPAFIFPLILIAVVYWFIGLLYVTTSRELKRMDVSPLHFAFSAQCPRSLTVLFSEYHPITPLHQFLRSLSRHVDHPVVRRQRPIHAQDLQGARSEYEVFLVPLADESSPAQFLKLHRIARDHFRECVCAAKSRDECGRSRVLDLLRS